MRSHNLYGTSGFTLKYRPWKVIYVEFFEDKTSALEQERHLKGGKGREWIREKIIPQKISAGFISA
ncbi:MAG: GIY-YIG nuclease family protein [Bacteroidia bacterium]